MTGADVPFGVVVLVGKDGGSSMGANHAVNRFREGVALGVAEGAASDTVLGGGWAFIGAGGGACSVRS